MKLLRFVVPVAVMLVVAGAALAAPSHKTAKVPTTKITVGATEYAFAVSKLKVPAGKVQFTITNKGTEPHDFKVIGKNPKSRFLGPGQKTTITVLFPKKGSFQFVCTIGEHAIKGMRGTLVVK